MTPYIVLGVYKPPFRKAWKIGEDLTTLTETMGLTPLKDPKHPAQDWAPWCNLTHHAEVKLTAAGILPEKANCWHYDGDTTPGAKTNCGIVLWSECTPTLVKLNGDDTVYRPKPYEVVLFHNGHCTHRRPDDAPYKRAIFRQRVNVPKHIPLP